MKKTLKRSATFLAALLMLVQTVPALAGTETYESGVVSGGMVGYREQLEIVASRGTYVLVGQTLELDVNEGYDHVVWMSETPDVATIDENSGLVTALKAGDATITASQDGQKATARVTVIDPEPIVKEAETAKTEPENTESAGQTSHQKQYMVIVINGESTRYVYDGEAHTLDTFIATSNDPFFSADKVKVTGEIGVSGTECGTYELRLKESDFAYDDPDVIASFVVNNSWMKITRAKVTVTADSLEKTAGEGDPMLTATVEGLYGDDTVEYSLERYAGEEPGQYIIEATGAKQQGNYSVSFADGILTIQKGAAPERPLYNIVKIGGTYYRLAKTTIRTEKDPAKDPAGTLKPGDYTVEAYDFADLEIEINGKKYVYKCQENAEAIVMGANYYETNSGTVSIVKNKIGAISNGKVNWMVPESDRYPDKNETDSIHRDYEIKLYNGRKPAVEQTVYNMLSVNESADYHKMRATTIKAQPLDELKNGAVKEGEYIIDPYDFTNVRVTIDGVEYKYNDGSLNEYDNYFTVEFQNVEKSDRFNRNATWFKDRAGWLDGSFEQYGDLPNMTVSFHANYKATTHKGIERPRSVTIDSDWPDGKIAYPGAEITLTATLEGFSENVRLQWEYSTDSKNWTELPGENALTCTYLLDETTATYYWRVVAEDEN